MDFAHIACFKSGLGFGSVVGVGMSISRRHQALIGRLKQGSVPCLATLSYCIFKPGSYQYGGCPGKKMGRYRKGFATQKFTHFQEDFQHQKTLQASSGLFMPLSMPLPPPPDTTAAAIWRFFKSRRQGMSLANDKGNPGSYHYGGCPE